MKYWSRNIAKIKKATTIAFASLFLSLIFINIAKADDTKSTNYIYNSQSYSESFTIAAAKEEYKNAVCDVQKMRKRYQDSCYSCLVVKTLTETFMKACSKAYPVTKDAGTKICLIGCIIWLVIFALKNVSSFTSLEPANNVGDFINFVFKVFVALVFINAGVGVLVQYIIEPILVAGADYGLGIVSSATGFNDPTPEYEYDGVEVISTYSLNKLFGLNQAIDKTVSENLVIGNALICHANNAGAWVDASFLGLFSLKIPNFWLMLCGAAIWFAGFMLTLSISYYVLDVSFKLGFAIIILPIVIGLWPFDITRDKLSKVFTIVLKSAAIFAFLAITSSYALIMISTAMRDVNQFYDRIEHDDATWISQTFEITGSYFILIIFAYLYSLKMIGGTIQNYVNKFFSDGVFGNASPIHHKATHATDIAKQKAVQVGKGAAKLGGRAAKGMVRAAKGGETGGTTIYGNAAKAAGKFVQFGGKAAGFAGNLNKKMTTKLQNFSDKQVDKGIENKSFLRLKVGDLAGRLADKKLVPGANVSSAMGSKIESLGKRLEQHGKNHNQAYRDVKGQIKKAAKEELDLAKMAYNSAKQSVKGVAKEGVRVMKEDAKDIANAVGGAVKKTKVYQSAEKIAHNVGDVAHKTGDALANGYVAAKGGVIDLKTKAVDAGKRTYAYKGGVKTIQGVKFIGNEIKKDIKQTKEAFANAGKIINGKIRDIETGIHNVKENIKEAVVESTLYQVGQAYGDAVVQARDDIRHGYEGVREGVGNVVGDVRDGVHDTVQGVKESVKGTVNEGVRIVKDGTKEVGQSINRGLYNNLGGDDLVAKHQEASDARRAVAAQSFEKEKNKEKDDNKGDKDPVKTQEERERKERERKEKEEREKRDKEAREKREKERKEEEEKRKKENELIEQERQNKIKFDEEYRTLLRNYNVTDITSVDGLSDERKASLKENIERLKAKYKI